MRDVILLGATGSIGTQALDVISSRWDQYRVTGLAAGGGNPDLLIKQIRAFEPRWVAVADPQVAKAVSKATSARVLVGETAATELAGQPADVVLNAITGSAGLLPTLATLAAGTTLALANKESLVIGGRLVTEAATEGQIVAVDSEHSAFAQALRAGRPAEVRRLILTASGGPFRGRTRAELARVTAADALAHPTWDMGRVITINSATLVNKGLELLEAALLYDVAVADVTVVVHPQSVVHSMVEYVDGSTLAQCSPPDMRLPIALGLAWPDRVPFAAPACDWSAATAWTFEPLDSEVFAAVELARHCGEIWGTAPAVFNAANEICVDAFCQGDIGFLDIVDTVASVLADHEAGGFVANDDLTVAAVLAADDWARRRALEVVSA